MGRVVVALFAVAGLALALSVSCSSSTKGDGADMSVGNDLSVHRCLYVDDMDVTHGCTSGGAGPGDRDDGGGMAEVGPPDQGADLMNLPFASPCLNNAQCASGICYDYRVKGYYCTELCATDSDCPAPSPGCGGMYVCRMPDPTSP